MLYGYADNDRNVLHDACVLSHSIACLRLAIQLLAITAPVGNMLLESSVI